MRDEKATGKGEKYSEPRKKKLRERLAATIGFPSDAVGISDGFMAEIRGRSGVTVKGCRKILSYSHEAVTFQTRDGRVTVTGCELRCVSYFGGAVGIEGILDGVFFEESRERLRCLFLSESGEDGV